MGRAESPKRIAIACVLVAIFLHDLLPHPSYHPPWGDLLYFQFLWSAGRTTWMTYGQMPFWNPYQCGGMVELGNVHSMAWSPFFLTALIFDAGTSIRIFILLHFVIAFLGMGSWARQRGIADPWAIAPAIAFAMCGFFASRSVGHLSFLPFAWVPWLLLLHERAQTERRWAFLIGALIALCLYSGGPYPTTFGVLLIVALTVRDLVAAALGRVRGARVVDWTGPLVIAVLAALGFLLVGAFKLAPTLEYMHANPRAMPVGADSLGAGELVEILLYRPFTRERPGYTFPFDEYRAYVGPGVVLGVLLTLLHGRARWRDVAIVGFFTTLVFGDHGPLSPYTLLHELPGFSSQRVPSRYVILILPFLALWFGQALADIAGPRTDHEGRTRWRTWFAAIALVATFIDLTLSNTVMLREWFTVPPPEIATPLTGAGAAFRHRTETTTESPTTYIRAPLDGYGFLSCDGFEPNPPVIAPEIQTQTDEPIEMYPFRGNQARVVRFTPNRVTVEVDFTQEASLVLNENYYPGWASDFGPAYERGGRAAFTIPTGTHTVVLAYRPVNVEIYAALTALGLVGVAVALFIRR
ncbi:MAG: hypothetical protein ABI080_07585 [Candidatus Binatia bacterium]